MSKLREEILQDLNEYLRKWGLINQDQTLTDEIPYPLRTLDDPEKEGRFMIYIEEKWKVDFERVFELKEKRLIEEGFDVNTVGDLVTLIIQLMNDLEPPN